MYTPNKAELEQELINIWGLSNDPYEISHNVFELVWLKTIPYIEDVSKEEFIEVLIKEGNYIVEIVNICRNVYKKGIYIKVSNVSVVFNQLKHLDIKGSINLTRGILGREVIEWNYRLSIIKVRKKTRAIIKHELKKVKREDILIMSEVMKKYNFQVEEEWSDIDKGSISCYLGCKDL